MIIKIFYDIGLLYIRTCFLLSMRKTVLFYDGNCSLCHWSVQFILRYEKDHSIHFASLQSDFFKRYVSKLNSTENITDSVILIRNNFWYQKSSAVIELASLLRFPFSLLRLLKIVPKSIADKCYDFIAQNRYRWFGRRQTCFIPSFQLKGRFLE